MDRESLSAQPIGTIADSAPDYQTLMEVLESLRDFRISRKRIDVKNESLGFGGYGDVKLATLFHGGSRFLRKGKDVAVKQLRASGNQSERHRIAFMFVRELKVWAAVKHSNILPLVGFYLDENMETAWLISSYQKHGNIREYLDREKPDRATRLQLAVDTANGLAYLHERAVCHGDIKSGNVMVNDDRRAMLCDFGLAKIMQDAPSGLTTSKGLKGSTRYLAPELVNEHPPVRTAKTDVWAWACLLVEILLNRIPYSDVPSEYAVINKIAQSEPPAPLDDQVIVKPLKGVLTQCWLSQPDQRWSMENCISGLEMLTFELVTPPSRVALAETSNSSTRSSETASSASEWKRVLLELLSSERAYAADLALVRDIHIPLSRGLLPRFDLPSLISVSNNVISKLNYDSPSLRSSTYTPASAETSASGAEAPSSLDIAELPMSPDASKVIFGNIEEIALFSGRFAERLEDTLSDLLDGIEGEVRVGELFMDMIPVMIPLYEAYITRHPTAVIIFQSLPPCVALTKYLAQTCAVTISYTDVFDIPSLLIKPIQRLLKYSQLLSTLYHETPDDHGDKPKLLEARESLEEVTGTVNEGRRLWELIKVDGSTLTRPSQTVAPSRSGRMNSFRSQTRPAIHVIGDLGRELEELEQWKRRIKECELVIKDLARHTLKWHRELDGSLKRLEGWNLSFGAVLGLGAEPFEAVGAFAEVVAGIRNLSSNSHKTFQTGYLRQLSTLLHTLTSPRTLLAHINTLRYSHITLLNTSHNMSHPPISLVKASNDYLALQAILLEELPNYVELFEKGLAVLLLGFSRWQRNLWREVKEHWISFWISLAVEGEAGAGGALAVIGSGSGEIIKIWKERFEKVELELTLLHITAPPPKTHRRRSSVYGRSDGSSTSVQERSPRSIYQQPRSQSAHELLGNPSRGGPSQSSESIGHQFPHRSSNSSPSLRSRRKGRGSAASEASIPPSPIPPSPTPPSPAPPRPALPHAEMAFPENPLQMVGHPAMLSQKRARNKPQEECRPGSTKTTSKLTDGPALSERLQAPLLAEPFGQDYSAGRVFPSSPSLLPGSFLTSPREKGKGKGKERETTKDGSGFSEATGLRPFRWRLPDDLVGLPRSSSRGRSRSLSADTKMGLNPERPSQRDSIGMPSQGLPATAPSGFASRPSISFGSAPSSIPSPLTPMLGPPTSPLYQCMTMVPFIPSTSATYMDLPFLKLNVGDFVEVLVEAGDLSEHELSIFVEEGDDCLLLARDESGRTGWVIASFVMPLA